MSIKLEKVELKWMDSNLLFCGIPEGNRDENCEQLVRNILNKLEITNDDHTLEFAHRTGQYSKDKVRPVLVRFHHIKDRNATWLKRKNLLDREKIHVKACHPPAVLNKRRTLQTINDYAVTLNKYKGHVWVKHNNTLQVNKSQYSVDNLDQLPDDLQVPHGTKKHGEILTFFGRHCPFSNFYSSPFTLDGLKFSCVEQFYYYSKADHYRDQKAMIEIMASSDPAEMKFIGKSINSGDREWNTTSEALSAMHKAVNAKFLQNSYLRNILLATDELIIAEANPHDCVWGIGHSISEPKAYIKDQWRGDNQLGDILMAVRHSLYIDS